MNVVALVAREDAASITSQNSPLPWKLVTHQRRPDTDAWACLWAAFKFVVKDDPFAGVYFVPAGNTLPPHEADGYRVLHMDTGKGEVDQHEKELKRSSSFELFCRKYNLLDDPAIKPILEMTIATDNVEAISRTSVHYVLKGLAYHYKDPSTKEIDWQAAQVAAFVCLDILYGQAEERIRNRAVYDANKEGRTLQNGIKIGHLYNRPGTRDAAFEDGCDVVCYFVKRGGKKFYPIIQCNRNSPVLLDRVIFGLRAAEGKKRNVQTRGVDLWTIGSNPLFGAWFFHDSRKMLACGTNGHELETDDEFTQLSMKEIMEVVYKQLGELPTVR